MLTVDLESLLSFSAISVVGPVSTRNVARSRCRASKQSPCTHDSSYVPRRQVDERVVDPGKRSENSWGLKVEAGQNSGFFYEDSVVLTRARPV